MEFTCFDPFIYDPRLARVRAYVREHFSTGVNLSTAADVAALEPTYFSKYFKRKTGTNFSKWVTRFRIEKATELLSSSNYRVSEVAFLVGFADVQSFSKSFKRETGTTPMQFKGRVLELQVPEPTT